VGPYGDDPDWLKYKGVWVPQLGHASASAGSGTPQALQFIVMFSFLSVSCILSRTLVCTFLGIILRFYLSSLMPLEVLEDLQGHCIAPY